jgi:hypothetical protein
MYLKATWGMIAVSFFIVVSTILKYENSKYIGVIAFGYTCTLVWGEARPL